MYKKIYSNNANCYIISICDCNTIISEIIEWIKKAVL
jgi:hypothetical protein